MDFSAFMALADGCSPRVDIRPLTEIVRAASGFEPLSLTIYGRKPIKILATSKDEAIALAMQAKVGAQDVRLGLAGLTFGDLDKTGISVANAFESCSSLRAAAQILDEDPKHFSSEKTAVVPNLAGAKVSPKEEFDREADLREEQPTPPGTATLIVSQAPPKKRWDVFGAGSGKSLLVYESSPSPREGTSRKSHLPPQWSSKFMTPSFARRFSFHLLASVAVPLILSGPALAQSANVERVLQNIVDALTGNVAKLLATLAIIITGMSWMFGYLDLRRAGYVILGVAILFGAAEIVSTLTGR